MSCAGGFPDFDFPQPRVAPPGGRNVLRDGLAWLTAQLKANASESIIYTDQVGHHVACQAVVGRKLLKIQDEDGNVRVEMTDADFLIPAADLAVGGVQIEPRRGDQITVTVGADVQTFDVLPYGNEPCWKWSDPIGQTLRRIHAKLTDVGAYS